MKQTTLANNDFEQFRKPTRRDRFLAEMNTVVPWADLVAVIEPCYPKVTNASGRPPVGLERMLRIHCLQLWFGSTGCNGLICDMSRFGQVQTVALTVDTLHLHLPGSSR